MLEFLASSLRLATPLIFAAMGGCLAERSGIATICLEGALLISGFIAASVAHWASEPYLGLLAGATAGILCLVLHGVLTQYLKIDAILSGIAVNLLCSGLCPFLSRIWFESIVNTPSLPHEVRLLSPSAFGQPALVYVALVIPFFLSFLLEKTGAGIRITAAGESPEALRAVGISPVRVRFWALAAAGVVASLGGTFLSISHSSQFVREMSAGRGFIALAAVIFGKWHPVKTLGACLLFGAADALQIQLQSKLFFGSPLPVQAIQSLPYVLTLIVLAGWAGKSRPPAAIQAANEHTS